MINYDSAWYACWLLTFSSFFSTFLIVDSGQQASNLTTFLWVLSCPDVKREILHLKTALLIVFFVQRVSNESQELFFRAWPGYCYSFAMLLPEWTPPSLLWMDNYFFFVLFCGSFDNCSCWNNERPPTTLCVNFGLRDENEDPNHHTEFHRWPPHLKFINKCSISNACNILFFRKLLICWKVECLERNSRLSTTNFFIITTKISIPL